MKNKALLLLVPVLLLCGCERSIETDPVLFCDEYNRTTSTAHLKEDSTYKRNDNEWILTAECILFRLRTGKNNSIQTVILTAEPQDEKELFASAKTAFAITAKAYGESVPKNLLQNNSSEVIQNISTRNFQYIVYKTEDCITVQQRLLHSTVVDEPSSLRHPEHQSNR